MDANFEWLNICVEHYQDGFQTNTCESINHFDELVKLWQGFMSTDTLDKVDIGDGSILHPTFMNQNLEADYKS